MGRELDTELLNAAYEGDTERVQALIAAGATPDAVDHKGFTALMFAAESGKPETVHILLEAGARTDQTDPNGDTACDHALSFENRDCEAHQACAVLILEAEIQRAEQARAAAVAQAA